MCKPSTPKYEKPPSYAKERQPDNAALYEEAVNRAGGAGKRRSTIGTTQRGLVLGASTANRASTVLG